MVLLDPTVKMSVEVATPQTAKTSLSHPLAPLSASEITTAAATIRASWPAHTDLQFKVITLHEPPKADALRYLDAEYSQKARPNLARKAFINYYIRNTVCVIK